MLWFCKERYEAMRLPGPGCTPDPPSPRFRRHGEASVRWSGRHVSAPAPTRRIAYVSGDPARRSWLRTARQNVARLDATYQI